MVRMHSMMASQPGAAIRNDGRSSKIGDSTTSRLEIDRDFALVRTRTKDFSRTRDAAKIQRQNKVSTWNAPKYEVQSAVIMDDLEEISFSLEEPKPETIGQNHTQSSSGHSSTPRAKMRVVKNNSFLGDMVHQKDGAKSPGSPESKRGPQIQDTKTASAEIFKVHVGPGRLGMKLKPGPNGKCAIISGFSQVQGSPGSVEKTGVARPRMYLINVDGQHVSLMEFPNLLKVLRSLNNSDKDLYFSYSLNARSPILPKRVQQSTSSKRTKDEVQVAAARSASRKKKSQPRVVEPASQKELTLDDYLASLDDDDESDISQ